MINLTKIYRVEDECRFGPFNSGAHMDWAHSDEVCSQPNNHPNGEKRWPRPEEDGIPHNAKGLFGFATLEQLLDWFNHVERKALAKAGYRISVYVVPSSCVVHGNRQSIFKYHDTAASFEHGPVNTLDIENPIEHDFRSNILAKAVLPLAYRVIYMQNERKAKILREELAERRKAA